MAPKPRNTHIDGKIHLMPLNIPHGSGIIGIQADSGPKVAYIPEEYRHSEGNAEEMVNRWNSWEKNGLLDALIKELEAVATTPPTLQLAKSAREQFVASQELARTSSASVPKDG